MSGQTRKDEQLTKRVEFAAKDADEQIATGTVMVPNAVDRQGDWEQSETIAQFAEQFENFEEVGEADGGVMHAVWPSEHISLERNEVLDEATEIGGESVEAGVWIQSWKFEDEELWALVDDGVLEGYSIGAVDVEWSPPMDQDELPDEVRVPDDIPEDEPVYELRDGIIQEVSAVDIPAVPDALIHETKADAEKRLADHLGNRDGFIEEATERGHDEADAERLWEYLNRAADVEGAGEPGKQSVLARAGKAFLSALSGPDDDTTDTKTSEAPDRDTAKEGRTLSRQNEDDLKAVIDAATSIFRDAGRDPGITRFTDREDDGFDLSEHTAREFADPDDDEEDEPDMGGGEVTNPIANDHDPDGDTSDDNTTMSDDDPMADAPDWAKALHDDIEENSKRIDDALGDDEKDAFDNAPEWAKSLKESTEKNAERIDAISKQTGATESQQLGGAEKGGDDEGGLGDRQKFFIPESKRRAAGAGGSR